MKLLKKLSSVVTMTALVLSLIMPTNVNATIVTANNSLVSNATALDTHLLEEMKNNSGLLNVIVTFKGDSAPTNENVNLLKTLGIDTGITMQSLPIAGVLATAEQINALADSEQVRSIYLNREVEFYNADATELTGVNKVRVDDDMRKANGGLPVSGKGVGVIINDSGVDGTHPDLKLGKNLVQNVLGTTNMTMFDGLAPVVYLEDVANTDTNSGHGTHVAGTVGGTGQMSSGLHAGVAPGADLIGYGSGGVVFILDMIGGFDYAITNQFKHNIRVITNSWGTNDDFFPDDPVNVASKRCYDRGIVVLFAAGNSGPEEDTHNPYAKAPWVISVAAGKKDGTLVNFSSRGTRGVGETFEVDGETWTWKDEPTITAPGVDIVSTRVIAPLGALSATKDINLDPAHVPFYAHMSGTSMATPHAAGIVTLLLEANPLLSPMDVKEILQKTATNMPGRDAYEVGAGYINAYAAVDLALNKDKKYGDTLTIGKEFNAYASMNVTRDQFEIDYSLLGNDSEKFHVMEGQSQLVVKVYADGDHPTEEGGNPVGFTITDPNGAVYGSGINLLYSIDLVDTITVDNPVAGEWTVTIEPYAGIALPEKIVGTITQKTATVMTGLSDIAGHPAEGAIVVGINERLFDAMGNGEFKPNEMLTRLDLANYLTMGAGVRQVASISNDAAIDAVLAKGASLKGMHKDHGVMRLDENGHFNEKGTVTRADLAYSLVQSLGLQEEAENFTGTVTVSYKGEAIAIEDDIPAHLKGYVQLALNLGIINAYFSTTQGPYDLEPTVHATFAAEENVTRAQFAVAMTRFFNNYK